MRPFHWSIVLVFLVLFSLRTDAQLRIEGKGEEFHHAMIFHFLHSADHANALVAMAELPRPLNMPIALDHQEEIVHSLAKARTHHAMVHKTYDNVLNVALKENHDALLLAHNRAIELADLLVAELRKKDPDMKIVGQLAGTIAEQALRAALEHRYVLRKLEIADPSKP